MQFLLWTAEYGIDIVSCQEAWKHSREDTFHIFNWHTFFIFTLFRSIRSYSVFESFPLSLERQGNFWAKYFDRFFDKVLWLFSVSFISWFESNPGLGLKGKNAFQSPDWVSSLIFHIFLLLVWLVGPRPCYLFSSLFSSSQKTVYDYIYNYLYISNYFILLKIIFQVVYYTQSFNLKKTFKLIICLLGPNMMLDLNCTGK